MHIGLERGSSQHLYPYPPTHNGPIHFKRNDSQSDYDKLLFLKLDLPGQTIHLFKANINLPLNYNI